MPFRVAKNLRKTLPAVSIGALILLLGLAATRAQSEIRRQQARAAVQQALESAAARISKDLFSLRSELAELTANSAPHGAQVEPRGDTGATAPHVLWRSDGRSIEFLTPERLDIPAPSTGDYVGEGRGARPRLVTTRDGKDTVTFARRVDGSPDPIWLGASMGVAELMEASGLSEVIRSGVNVTVADEAERPLFWTAPAALVDPVSSSAHLGTSAWRIQAAPSAGWSDAHADWQSILLSAVLATACSLTVFVLAREPDVLRDQLALLTADLDAKDRELSRLLRSRSQIESQLLTSLTVDLHTGLPNRASFVEDLQARLAKSRRSADGGVLVVSVQFYKLGELAHSMGATVADELVRQAAERLQTATSRAAFLARTGERELALCFPRAAAAEPSTLVEPLLRVIEERFELGHRTLYLAATAGVAISDDGYQHGPELLTQSALAANTAVADGQRWAVFKPEAKERRISLLQLEADLQAAIDSEQLRVFFQPIVSVIDGNIVGFESLLRWQHPTESWITPDRFIPLAEGMGQMARISDWVLRQGVAHSKQFSHLRQDHIYVTVNLTPRDLNRETCNRLFELLDSSSLPTQCIRVEVTETAVIRDFRVAARLIAELNERGVRVLLDDFGTGYSSLSYLRDLPFHAVKIDKSFIQKMTTEARDFGLVRSIVGLVHYLGMECVAEGIETQEQLDLVAMTDCNYWQGYFFSPPVPASEVERLIRDPRRKPSSGTVAA